jgi:hypothetical protein
MLDEEEKEGCGPDVEQRPELYEENASVAEETKVRPAIWRSLADEGTGPPRSSTHLNSHRLPGVAESQG